MRRRTFNKLLGAGVATAALGRAGLVRADESYKAGFIYVGPVADRNLSLIVLGCADFSKAMLATEHSACIPAQNLAQQGLLRFAGSAELVHEWIDRSTQTGFA